MIDATFASAALEKFVGCDSDESNAGSPECPSIWMFGIEHGETKRNQVPEPFTGGYSISEQLTYPYNQKAFKLLSAIEGRKVSDYKAFAEEKQPFVSGVPGYFKGNLYPFACRNVHTWPTYAALETGTNDKREYQVWCRQFRLPTLKRWIDEYGPKLFIGVGIGCRDEFVQAVFGESASLTEHRICVGDYQKRVFSHVSQAITLVVVPHFSGANGLNSDDSIQQVGTLIAGLIPA